MKNNPHFKKLKGRTFEVDETFVGGKQKNKHYDKRVKGTQGRSLKAKSAVLGLLDRDTGWVVPLLSRILNHVEYNYY